MKNKVTLLLYLILTALGLSAQAGNDFASAQAAFESRLQQRFEMILLPLVGKDNYSLNLSVVTQKSARGVSADQVYFSKLGFAAQIQDQTPYNFENDITDFSVEVAISENVKNLNLENLKTRLEATAKAALPQLKKNIPVTITAFTPAKTSSVTTDPRFWTPLALVICAALIVFGLTTSARRISKINFSNLNSTPSAAPTKAATLDQVFQDKKNSNLKSRGHNLDKFEGIQKWSQWTNEDLPSACNFIEKISRSDEENDLALLAYIFHGSNLTNTRKMLGGLRKEALGKVKKVIEFELKTESFAELDAVLTQHITQHFVFQSLDSEHLLQYIHDFTIDEAVFVTSQKPAMLELFMKYYSSPQMEQIMGWVSFEALNQFLQMRTTTTFNLIELAQQAHQMILARRKSEESRGDHSVTKWLEVAAQLDSERELAFYQSLAHSSPEGELATVAIESFPQFLIAQLPDKIIKPTLNSYPLEERADYIFTLTQEQRLHYLGFFATEPRVREVLEIEIEQIAADISRRTIVENRREIIVKEFNHRIRKYIQSSPENQQLAMTVFNSWIVEARKKNVQLSSAA